MAARACVAPDTVLIRTAAGSTMIGKIRNHTNGVVDVVLPEVVAAGSVVDIEISACRGVSGEVMHCTPCQEVFNAAICFAADGARTVRAMPTFEVHEAAMVAMMSCPYQPLVQAQVRDASKTRLGLVLDRPLLADEWVKIETRSCVVFGDIVHCMAHAGDGYRAGLAIDTVIFRLDEDSNGGGLWAPGLSRREAALGTLLSTLGWRRAG